MLTRARLVRLCRARHQLRELSAPPLSVAELAAEAGLSTGVFIRQFAAVFGETPHQHRIRARLDYAKHLLARDRSVTEVCFEVGFSSLGSFSQLFSRRVGVPPSVYRRRIRALVQVPSGLPGLLAPGCFSLMSEAFARLSANAISEKHRQASGAKLPAS